MQASQAALAKKFPDGQCERPACCFDVPDGQFHSGMGPVEGVGRNGRLFGVGGEGVVSPVGPQLRLGGICQAGAAHHHPHPMTLTLLGGGKGGLCYLRLAVLGVADGLPVVLFDVRDCLSDVGILR